MGTSIFSAKYTSQPLCKLDWPIQKGACQSRSLPTDQFGQEARDKQEEMGLGILG